MSAIRKRGGLFLVTLLLILPLSYACLCGKDNDESCLEPCNDFSEGTADEVKTYCTTNTCFPEQLKTLTESQKTQFWSNPLMAGKNKDKLSPANVQYIDTSNPEVLHKIMPIILKRFLNNLTSIQW